MTEGKESNHSLFCYICCKEFYDDEVPKTIRIAWRVPRLYEKKCFLRTLSK